MATAQRVQLHNPSQGLLVLPVLPPFDLNDNTFFSVYSFIKNFIGVTGCKSSIIDTKIERAMDVVKSHIMFMMREEVEVLKERIVTLLDRIKHLEMENHFLKSNASPEILQALNEGIETYKEIGYDENEDSEDMEVANIIRNAENAHII